MLAPNFSADYEKIKTLFAAALEIAPERRAEFFVETGAEADLVAEVESLLEAREAAGEFLNDVSAAASVQNSFKRNDGFIGQTIGKYRIAREIGRGGMGVVYLATREDFKQNVALKLIKRGMDSDAILTRFRREREILAALNHPFIARLLDGGATSDDLPFFVMELVEGVPIDEFCRKENLSEKEKLELFRKVCEALSFAHQKLIVHRDLKPSNILITENGTPKLLDFGVAKLLGAADAAETQTNQRVLTPAYASPEQIRGEAVDTTSDVFSLGKILAELLLGENFKDLRFTTAKKQTSKIPGKLNADLQNILAMSLREDRARRYGSVEKFSEDLRLYLNGLPVSARKDTFAYRAAKFLKRNRFAVAVSTLFVLTLLASFAATFWQARKAEREREIAEREREIAERRLDDLRKMSDSFTTEIHGAIENLPGSLPARRLLMRHAVEQLDALASQSADNSPLQDELAQAYYNSAQLPDMLLAEKDSTLKKGIGIYQKLLTANPENARYQEQIALGETSLADITNLRGSQTAAIELTQNAVARLEKIVVEEPGNESHLSNLANGYEQLVALYILKGDAANASQMTQKQLSLIAELKKLNPEEVSLKALSDIAQIRVGTEQMMSGDFQSSISNFQNILRKYENAYAAAPNDTQIRYYLAIINRRLAEALDKNGEHAAASEHFKTALTLLENLAAESPRDFGYRRNTAATHILYGEMLIRRKQFAESLKHFQKAAESSSYILENDAESGESKNDLAQADFNVGSVLILNGKSKEGFDYLEKAVEAFQELLSRDTENAILQARLQKARERLADARNVFR